MRNTGNAKRIRKLTVSINVDLVNGDGIFLILGDFFENRRKYFAGRAPIGVEIQNEQAFL